VKIAATQRRIASQREPLAVIDIGSNTGRVTVLSLEPGGYLRVVGDASVPLRLVRDLSPNSRRHLHAATIAHTIDAVRGFGAVARAGGASRCIGVATAAVREAVNGRDLADRIRQQTGIDIEIISSSREAALAFQGAIHGLPVERGFVLDVGGGSLQLTHFRDRRLTNSWSLPLGALRLSDEFLTSDPPSPAQIGRLRKHVRKALETAALTTLKATDVLIGTGGTIRNLARVDRRIRQYPIPRLHGYVLPSTGVQSVASLVARSTLADRPGIAGLNGDRADSIVGGAAVVEEVMRELGATEIPVSGHRLREGVALDAWLPELPQPRAIRSASITGLGARLRAPPALGGPANAQSSGGRAGGGRGH
jgi:exopolyphosphatase/guanosine-5'-triphosphate,3'-diphosphate pyrophosphatase